MVVLMTEHSVLGEFLWESDSTLLTGSPRYLPQNQCPVCLDVGQDLYRIGKQWIHKCPYCNTQYTLRLERKGGN